MKQLIIFITLIAVLTAAKTKSAEVIPVWDKTVEGEVQDMDFLKGQNEVLMLVGEGSSGQIQRRNPENGDLIHSFPQFMSSFTKLAITPDSLRFVHINGNGGLLRAIDDNYSILEAFDVEQEDSIVITYSVIAIDPIRPNAYVTTYGWNKNTNNYAPRGKVIAYNYETGEHIKDLTPYGEYEYTAIEVSHDGRYLATLNDNKAYLKVWDLETMEQIINEPLFDENSDDWCEAQDIYFSKINPDLIYYSGKFTNIIKDISWTNGIFTFSITNKDKKRLLENNIYAGNSLIFLKEETILFNTSGGTISVLNLLENRLEYYDAPKENVFSSNVIHNTHENYFLGTWNNKISKFTYESQSNIENNIEEEITISPNPTNNFVNITIETQEQIINYKVSDLNGQIINQSFSENHGGSLQIDFMPYPAGVYFLTINCNVPKTYKVVKEG